MALSKLMGQKEQLHKELQDTYMYMCVFLGGPKSLFRIFHNVLVKTWLFGQPYICVCLHVQSLAQLYTYYVSAKFYMGKSARYGENIEQKNLSLKDTRRSPWESDISGGSGKRRRRKEDRRTFPCLMERRGPAERGVRAKEARRRCER